MYRLTGSLEGAFGSPIRNLVGILVFMGLVVAGAIWAYMAAGWSFEEASYMVTLTVFSVGYGEVHPVNTPYLHTVTMSTMVLGCTGMILLTGTLVQVLTALQLRALFGADRMQHQVDQLDGHVILCGYGRFGIQLAQELKTGNHPFVLVDRDPVKLADAENAGILCIPGDATDETALITAGIHRARVLATVLPDDAANVFITLSARNLNPKIKIFSRGEAPSTEGKLRHAGANEVVLPTHIGAERIADMILYPGTANFIGSSDQLEEAHRWIEMLGLEIELVKVVEHSALAGSLVGEAERRVGPGFLIVQINRPDGTTLPRPGLGERINPDDDVIFVTRDHDAATAALFTIPTRTRTGRGMV